MASLKYWLWLSTLPGVGNQMKLALLEHFGEPDAAYYGDKGEYLLVEGMTRKTAAALGDKSMAAAEKVMEDCDRVGLRVLTIRDAEYPSRLKNIYDPPILLYVQGRLPAIDDEVAIAMVGSRRTSGYGITAGEKLAYQITRQGGLVVSGLAAGGDASAHRGALRAGGPTVAVIANGHDVIYPLENRRLYADIAVQGSILSEYPPGTEPMAKHFPVRNRIISGLCLATIVIEAPKISGALITADRALSQGRDVFVIPGRLDDPLCVGSNQLLRDGAGVVTDAWDVLGHFAEEYPAKLRRPWGAGIAKRFGGWKREEKENGGVGKEKRFGKKKGPGEDRKDAGDGPARRKISLHGSGFTDDQLRIVELLGGGTAQVDDIVDRTGIPIRRVLSALTMLEIDGIVSQASGKNFTLAVTVVK